MADRSSPPPTIEPKANRSNRYNTIHQTRQNTESIKADIDEAGTIAVAGDAVTFTWQNGTQVQFDNLPSLPNPSPAVAHTNFLTRYDQAVGVLPAQVRYLGVALNVLKAGHASQNWNYDHELELAVEEWYNIQRLKNHVSRHTPATWVAFQWILYGNISDADKRSIQGTLIKL